ncbi:MucR family transcriptional regulator [Methylobacterium sp. sgz302541]|uniref:MucR family transcriptional regulator n=1 Tax=unclassified Methylobacterium TaxID=2615210 RepID=UPI003D35076E
MSEAVPVEHNNHVELAADIVSAYVSNNSIPVADLAALIASVHAALSGLGQTQAASEEPEKTKASPAQIRKSVTPDALVSFIDGKPYKSLKRHLTRHGLDAHGYRDRYGLPADYPMVSASYSAARSALAKNLGLGQQRRKTAEAPATPEPAPEPEVKKTRGRKKAVADA